MEDPLAAIQKDPSYNPLTEGTKPSETIAGIGHIARADLPTIEAPSPLSVDLETVPTAHNRSPHQLEMATIMKISGATRSSTGGVVFTFTQPVQPPPHPAVEDDDVPPRGRLHIRYSRPTFLMKPRTSGSEGSRTKELDQNPGYNIALKRGEIERDLEEHLTGLEKALAIIARSRGVEDEIEQEALALACNLVPESMDYRRTLNPQPTILHLSHLSYMRVELEKSLGVHIDLTNRIKVLEGFVFHQGVLLLNQCQVMNLARDHYDHLAVFIRFQEILNFVANIPDDIKPTAPTVADLRKKLVFCTVHMISKSLIGDEGRWLFQSLKELAKPPFDKSVLVGLSKFLARMESTAKLQELQGLSSGFLKPQAGEITSTTPLVCHLNPPFSSRPVDNAKTQAILGRRPEIHNPQYTPVVRLTRAVQLVHAVGASTDIDFKLDFGDGSFTLGEVTYLLNDFWDLSIGRLLHPSPESTLDTSCVKIGRACRESNEHKPLVFIGLIQALQRATGLWASDRTAQLQAFPEDTNLAYATFEATSKTMKKLLHLMKTISLEASPLNVQENYTEALTTLSTLLEFIVRSRLSKAERISIRLWDNGLPDNNGTPITIAKIWTRRYQAFILYQIFNALNNVSNHDDINTFLFGCLSELSPQVRNRVLNEIAPNLIYLDTTKYLIISPEDGIPATSRPNGKEVWIALCENKMNRECLVGLQDELYSATRREFDQSSREGAV